MKRIYMTLLGMLSFLIASYAYDFEKDGIYYTITSDSSGTDATVEVAQGRFIYSGKIVVPDQVEHEGKTFSVTGLGFQSFRYNTSLDTLLLPATIEYIADEAFYGCRMKELRLPESVASIGKNVFTYSYFKAIEIPSSVTLIANGAFYRADSLQSVTVATGNTAYSSLDGILFDKEASRLICFPPGKETTAYTVPSSTLALEDGAFAAQQYLKSIHLPSSTTVIGENVFENILDLEEITVEEGNPAFTSHDGVLFSKDLSQIICFPMGKSVSSYTLPDGLEKIGNMALAYAPFETLVIPASVREIGDSALFGCSRLKSLEIPASVEKIGSYAFAFCRSLKEAVLPEPLTEIAPGLFYVCDSLESVNIPDGVTRIGASAFWSCSFLRAIELPDAIESIESNALASCEALTSIELPKNLRSLGNFALAYNYNLKSVDIPSGIDTLPIALFYDCKALEQANCPEGLAYIGNLAFSSCGSLRTFKMPNSVSNMGTSVFEYSGISSITLSSSLQSIPENTFSSCFGLQSIQLPSSVKNIGSEAFYYCSNLKEIGLPAQLDSIGESAFRSCSALESINLPSGLQKIDARAFYGCAALTSLILPDSVLSIGSNAFYNCSNLTSVKMPALLEELGTYAFGWCENLQSITLPASLKRLGASAFENCRSLRSLNIPDSIQAVEDYLAGWCDSLQSLSLGKSVEEIGYWAFSGCDSIADLHVYASTPPDLEKEAFTCYETAVLRVPAGTLQAYSEHPVWSLFAQKEEMEECTVPYDLLLNGAPGYYELSLSWSGKSPAYQLEWKKDGTEEANHSESTENMFTIKELEPNTGYHVRVRGICAANDTSAWCEWALFHTAALPACPEPFGLESDAITETSARLSWKADDENETFTLRYKKASDSEWDSINDLLEREHILSGLQTNTAYVWSVRAACSEGRYSGYSMQDGFETKGAGNEQARENALFVRASKKQIHILNPSASNIDRIRIYDMSGMLLASHEIGSNENVILPADFSARMLIVSVEDGPAALRFKVYMP